MSRAPSSRAQAGTTEARWVQWLLIGLALAFLLVRPAGLFGERAIERV